jgi:transcriptional regulator with XRE-family HTH domain
MDRNTRQTVAANVRRLRTALRWSQSTLGHKAGIAQTAVSSVEQPDGKSPQLDTLDALAAALHVPTWTLLIDSDDLDAAKMATLDLLTKSFVHLPPSGQEQVTRVAEAEARYAKLG